MPDLVSDSDYTDTDTEEDLRRREERGTKGNRVGTGEYCAQDPNPRKDTDG